MIYGGISVHEEELYTFSQHKMRITSVNRGEAKTVRWRGKPVRTGIFKYPVDGPIFLGAEDVVNDAVVDRKHHGGVDMAVYAYSADHYSFWKEQFPDAEWDLGMFGENLTVSGLDETQMHIGSIYSLGDAQVQVCQPRQPCFKLGIRFGTQKVLKPYIRSSYCGVYFRVVRPGPVQVGDTFKLVGRQQETPTIAEVFRLMYHRDENASEQIEQALACTFLPEGAKKAITETQFRP